MLSWKQRESDNWETKAFRYSAKPNIGALSGKPLVHYLLALFWFILSLNRVRRKPGIVFLHRTWGMGSEELSGRREIWGWLPRALTDRRGRPPQHMPKVHQPLGLCPGSFFTCSEQLPLFPTPFCPPRSKWEVHPFWKAELWGWLWCLTLNSPGLVWILVSQSLPRSTIIVDFPVISVDRRHLEGRDHVSTLVSPTVWSWAWSPHWIYRMDIGVRELL